MSYILEFNDFRILVDSRVLLRRGEPVLLTAKVFDVLVVLAENSGKTLEKDDLIRQVWPDVAVDENNLTQAISKLRKVLGDDKRSHRYVVTIPRRGYKFVAPVRRVKAEPPAGARPGETRLAVLPVDVLTAPTGEDFLSIGIADAIVTRLGNVESLAVRPTSAVTRFTGAHRDAVEAGRALEVEFVVDVRLQRADDRYRVTAQLVDVHENRPVWSDSFEYGISDPFELQEAIAGAIASAVRPRLTAATGTGEKQVDRSAYVEYLRGKYSWTKRSPEGVEKSIASFERAVGLDPTFAPARAGLASAYALLGFYHYSEAGPAVAIEQAREEIAHALELEPRLVEAIALRGLIRHAFDRDFHGAEADFELARSLDPAFPPLDFWRSVHALVLGRDEEAMRAIYHALELDPVSPATNLSLGYVLYYSRRYPEAIATVRQVLDLEPNDFRAHVIIAKAYEEVGVFDDAVTHLERAKAISGGDVETTASLGHVWARAGQVERARGAFAALDGLSSKLFVTPFAYAVVHVGLGEHHRAFTLLEEAIAARAVWPVDVARDPRLDPMRGERRFHELLHALNLSRIVAV